jgi:hypothetical protein
MPATTPRGLPYPLGTDPVADGDDAIHNLATALDTAVLANWIQAGTIPSVSSTGAFWTGNVTFPKAFTAVPNAVIITGADTATVVWVVTAMTAAGFTFRAEWRDGSSHSTSGKATYIAVGSKPAS